MDRNFLIEVASTDIGFREPSELAALLQQQGYYASVAPHGHKKVLAWVLNMPDSLTAIEALERSIEETGEVPRFTRFHRYDVNDSHPAVGASVGIDR